MPAAISPVTVARFSSRMETRWQRQCPPKKLDGDGISTPVVASYSLQRGSCDSIGGLLYLTSSQQAARKCPGVFPAFSASQSLPQRVIDAPLERIGRNFRGLGSGV